MLELFKNVVLTVIGGVGYGTLSNDSKHCDVETPYGFVSASVFSAGRDGHDFDIALISRHQGKQHVPPHKVNYLALIDAARQINAPVLSINSVGLMRNVPLFENFETDEMLKKETFVSPDNFLLFPFFIPNDFIDITQNRIGTFYDGETVHADMTDPYCIGIRSLLFDILKNKSVSYSQGTYLCTEGPRFETKAEIRMYAHFADVVGMTGVPEVVLAKEAGLCYASLCTITNPAAGLSQNRVTADEVKVVAKENQETVFEIISMLSTALFEEKYGKSGIENKSKKACQCQNATISGKL